MKIQEIVVSILEEKGQTKSWLARMKGIKPQSLNSWLTRDNQGSLEQAIENLEFLDYKLVAMPVSGKGEKYTLGRK